jgi:hypothetical protein
VKSIVNETMTYLVGKYYTREVNGSNTVVKKYYTAGAKTIAVRTIEGSTNTLNWLLTDPLGSTLPLLDALVLVPRGASQNSHIQCIW